MKRAATMQDVLREVWTAAVANQVGNELVVEIEHRIVGAFDFIGAVAENQEPRIFGN